MSRKITVELTEAEALALLFASGNILEATGEDEQVQFFGNRQTCAAAHRADEKITAAIQNRGRRRKERET